MQNTNGNDNFRFVIIKKKKKIIIILNKLLEGPNINLHMLISRVLILIIGIHITITHQVYKGCNFSM